MDTQMQKELAGVLSLYPSYSRRLLHGPVFLGGIQLQQFESIRLSTEQCDGSHNCACVRKLLKGRFEGERAGKIGCLSSGCSPMHP